VRDFTVHTIDIDKDGNNNNNKKKKKKNSKIYAHIDVFF
jgi:hypothetical protein